VPYIASAYASTPGGGSFSHLKVLSPPHLLHSTLSNYNLLMTRRRKQWKQLHHHCQCHTLQLILYPCLIQQSWILLAKLTVKSSCLRSMVPSPPPLYLSLLPFPDMYAGSNLFSQLKQQTGVKSVAIESLMVFCVYFIDCFFRFIMLIVFFGLLCLLMVY
jgi:hypothetical protein